MIFIILILCSNKHICQKKAMIISVNKNSTLKDITEVFHNRYPYLKLEFFVDKNHDGHTTADEMLKNQKTQIGNFLKSDEDFEFEINGNKPIKTFETFFNKKFGLMVQVFFKRGNTWIMSTTSDKLTLNELNARAEEDNKPLQTEGPIDAADRMELE
jgi:hypothetical protein